jgi:hypothetical protein
MVFRLKNLEMLEMFYQICKEVKAETEEDRLKVLLEMARSNLIESVYTTKRTKKQLVEDFGKEHKVLDLTEKENEDNGIS